MFWEKAGWAVSFQVVLFLALVFSSQSLFAEEPNRNLLVNGSFEEGEIGKTPAGWAEWKRFSGESTFIKEKGGRTPESAGMAVVIQSPKDEFVLAEQWVKHSLKAGERYGLSFWLRSETRPVRVQVYLAGQAYDKDGKFLAETQNRAMYTVNSAWTRYTSVITIPEGKASENGALRCVVQLWEDPGVRVEIDGGQLFYLGVQPVQGGQ